MAGPSVVVRVLGDTKGLGASFDATAKTAQSASSRIHGAFTSVLGTLNRSGVLGPFGESLAQINDTLDGVAEHGRNVGQIMLGLGGTLAGVGLGLQAIGSKDQAAHQQLQAAVEATGASYEDYAKQVEQAVKTQEKFGDTANQTEDALRVLTQATHDPAKALQLLATASNIAAAKHEDLTSAAGQLGKVYNGNTKLLKEYGIAIDKTTHLTKDGKTATQALAEVTAGQASAAADTFTGKLDAVKAHVEDLAATFGQKYGPAITAAGAVMTGLGAAIEITRAATGAFAATQEASAAAQTAMVAATEAETAALEGEAAAATTADAASLPLIVTVGLIVLAIAALGAIAYVVYRNWTTIWAAMKNAAAAAFNWIKANWPLLLPILLGPIGVAGAVIFHFWDQIKAAGLAAIHGLETGWDAFVNFFVLLPGRIAHIAVGMWDGIANAFIEAINAIIRAWDSLHFSVGGFDHFGIHFGGVTIGTPHVDTIPHLAQGGLITQDGLVYAHAGEAITPAPGRTGPAVAIENAHFSSEVDVDLFMRRAAWVVQTARV